MSVPIVTQVDHDLSSPICDFNFADLAGYLLARQMKPSDAKRLRAILLDKTTVAIAALDLGLSRPSNLAPRNSVLLQQIFNDDKTPNDEQNRSNRKRPNRAGFALSRS